jgi:pimeloyl-ACP methyl ester carboxylesterase
MVWAPLGLEPFFRDGVIATLCALCAYLFVGTPLGWTAVAWVATGVALLIFYMGTHYVHTRDLRTRHLNAWKPTAIVYIVGLGEPFFMGGWCDWLFGGSVTPFVRVGPPTYCSPLCDLGDDPYVERVATAVAGLTEAQQERVALVGLSRGCSVAHRYVQRYPHSVACVVMLSGPFRKAHEVLRHRFGSTLASVLWAFTRDCTRPHEILSAAVPSVPHLYITATGDRAMPPADVRSWAAQHKAPLFELTSDTVGHVLYFGALADKVKVQDWIVEQMSKR